MQDYIDFVFTKAGYRKVVLPFTNVTVYSRKYSVFTSSKFKDLTIEVAFIVDQFRGSTQLEFYQQTVKGPEFESVITTTPIRQSLYEMVENSIRQAIVSTIAVDPPADKRFADALANLIKNAEAVPPEKKGIYFEIPLLVTDTPFCYTTKTKVCYPSESLLITGLPKSVILVDYKKLTAFLEKIESAISGKLIQAVK